MAENFVLDAVARFFRKDSPEAEEANRAVTVSAPAPKRRRSDALPMTYERRLASYGIRDPNTGAKTGTQTPAQRRRIRKKIGHNQRRAVGSNE